MHLLQFTKQCTLQVTQQSTGKKTIATQHRMGCLGWWNDRLKCEKHISSLTKKILCHKHSREIQPYWYYHQLNYNITMTTLHTCEKLSCSSALSLLAASNSSSSWTLVCSTRLRLWSSPIFSVSVSIFSLSRRTSSSLIVDFSCSRCPFSANRLCLSPSN